MLEGMKLFGCTEFGLARSIPQLTALALTRHNPVQIPILNLLVVLVLRKVELAAGQMPVQESNLLRFADSLHTHHGFLTLIVRKPVRHHSKAAQ